ncbi:MAG: pyruvate kinase [Flavobacteriales bacterium]|nr:pyruvate kinase [Flavobacteriales bacterium]
MEDERFNKTKIVATIGPATSNIETLKEMILAGMDVCRINFSHGTHEQHLQVAKNIKLLNKELGRSISLLGDLQGPKLRVGEVEEGTFLEDGSEVLITTEECIGNAKKIYVNYTQLPTDIELGEEILIDDGNIYLSVTEKIDEKNFKATVIYGGELSSKKGFNLPSTKVSLPSLTKKDLVDLEFAIKNHFDWIGLSFVRSSSDVKDLKDKIAKLGGNARVIAKIEKPQAVKKIKNIVKRADAIMVARGDLGVEMPMDQVPVIQKNIVEKCLCEGKPVIIATQMMESMINHPRPTRAEASDVANAVMDGADAVMLSAETSVGKYPVRAIKAMQQILKSTEEGWNIYNRGKRPSKSSDTFLSDEICYAATQISEQISAKAIISLTQSGYTAFKIASYRPNCNIFIFTSNKTIFRLLNLVWNVRVFYYDKLESTDKTISDVLEMLKSRDLIKQGDLVVHTASMPILSKARTNSLKISLVE